MTGETGKTMRTLFALALGLGFGLLGCAQTEYLDRDYFCTSQAQCADGFRCDEGERLCVPVDGPLPRDGALPEPDRGSADGGARMDRGVAPDAVVIRPDAGRGPDAEPDAEPDAALPDLAVDAQVPDAMAPPVPCEGDVTDDCCDDGQIAAGARCGAPLRRSCEGFGAALGSRCVPHEIVEWQAGICTAEGRCEPEPGGATWVALNWCDLEFMCGAGEGCEPQVRVNANGMPITCLGDDWCQNRQDGLPCHMPGQPNYPPTGVCVREVCVDLESDAAAATPTGPLTPLPVVDPGPEHFLELDGAPLRLQDIRTGLVWWMQPLEVNSLRAADQACDRLPPLRPSSPDHWRVPDVYELASLLPSEGIADLLVAGPLTPGPPFVSRSVANREDGAQMPVVVDFNAENAWLPEAGLEARTLCVYGARWTRGGDPGPISFVNGALDQMSGRNWGASGRGDGTGVVPKDQAACGALRSLLPPVGMAVALMRFEGGVRSLFAAPDDQSCFWTASTTPDGGRWWVKPYAGELGVARDAVWRCKVACTIP